MNKLTTASIPALLVIVGQTATGKSDLALLLAEKYDGEIICADSRTVYKDLDIGTAKPSMANRRRVRHYGLDLVRPDQQFTAADFKAYALQSIEAITKRARLPIMVGGSGLYIDGLLYDYQFGPSAEPALRQQLNAMSITALQATLVERGIGLPRDVQNPRRLIRAIETEGHTVEQATMRPRTLVFGLRADPDMLRERIRQRVDAMVEAGFVTELQEVSQIYGWNCGALQAPGYKAFQQYIAGDKSLVQAKQDFIQNDMQLAKRQLTWFKRNKSIHWLMTEDILAEAVDIATTFLNK